MKLIIFCYSFLGFLIYAVSLGNGFVIDDTGLIVNNPLIHNLSNIEYFFRGGNFYNNPSALLSGIYYKPIFSTVLSLIYTFFGAQPFFFHFFQLLFHITNAVLIYIFLKRLFSHKTSAILGAVFLVHPANVESVVYISAFQEVLFFFFGIVSILIFSKHQKLACLFLLLSLLTKETGILFVFTLNLYQYLFSKKYLNTTLKISGFVLLTYFFLRFCIAGIYFNQDAISPIMRADLFVRLITMPKILATYFLNLVFPLNLLSRQNWLVFKPTLNNFYLPLIFVGSVISTILFWGYKIRTTVNFNKYLFFLLCFGLGLGIHIQIIPLDATFANRWFYFILFGSFGLLGLIVDRYKNLAVPILIVIIMFSVRSFYRGLDWKDDFTLASKDTVFNTDSFSLESSLGALLINQGRYQEAKVHLEKSIKLFPTFMNWVNLAAAYEKMDNRKAAALAFEEAFKYGDHYLSAQDAVRNYLALNMDKEAASLATKKLLIFKKDPLLWEYLSIAYYRLGQKPLAINAINQAYSLSPNEEILYVKKTIENGEEIKFQ